MKKYTIILILIFLANINIFAQNKKEQIIILNNRIDSLLNIVINQSNTISQLSIEINSLNQKLIEYNNFQSQLKDSVSKKNIDIINKDKLISQLTFSKDSVSKLFYNQNSCTNTDWTIIDKGNSINDFTFDKNFNLFYKESIIKGVEISKVTNSIYISPISADNKSVICFTYGEFISEYNKPRFFLCNLETLTSNTISLKTAPLLWLSWSPNLTNVLVGGYYEADMTLYNITINPFSLQELKFDADLIKDDDNSPLEEISYDCNNVKWISENNVNIIANINCNPYIADDCGNDERKILLRSYTFTYDVKNNKTIKKILND